MATTMTRAKKFGYVPRKVAREIKKRAMEQRKAERETKAKEKEKEKKKKEKKKKKKKKTKKKKKKKKKRERERERRPFRHTRGVERLNRQCMCAGAPLCPSPVSVSISRTERVSEKSVSA